MNSGKIEHKIVTADYSAGNKKHTKETPVDGFKKGEVPARLDADVMRDFQRSLSEVRDKETTEVKGYPRPLTDYEKASFREYFPNLDVDKAVVTAPATPEYNCIAWTVGETHQWCWPPSMYPGLSEEAAFDKFYASYGFKPAPTGEVARWRNDAGLTHGCVSGPGHGPRWESKCGQELRIEHDLEELNGEIYGKPESYYTKEGVTRTPTPYKKMELPENIKDGVKEKASKVSPEIKDKFDGLYADWQNFRKEPRVCMSPNPADYCKTEAFGKITKMGMDAIPLLMAKIADGDFFCLQAVESIAKSNRGREGAVVLTKKEMNNSEQNKSLTALMKWYKE